MTSWGGGYVTDVAYMPGYYRQQSPAIMALACLLNGIAMPIPGPEEPVSYLELGCGQGLGALVLAASNPRWQVTAIDFNPAHVATARSWAAAIQLDNIRFLEADLATLADEPAFAAIPEVDFVSMHGLWSWVPPAVRSGIVRLLRARLKPGGAVHLSYNALPAWGPALGMQRLLMESGRRLATRSDRQAVEGLRIVQDLHKAEASHLSRSPWLAGVLERIGTAPIQYLAHEYMNDAWSPCFHADVAAALSDAKLEWAASANLVENFPELSLDSGQRAVMQRFDDPVMRELVKDMCLERSLRHDVFVRGVRRHSVARRDAALMDVWLSLNIAPDDMPAEAEMPAGRAALNPDFYRPIVATMARGPSRVGDLLAASGKPGNAAELVGLLVGLDIAEPVSRPGASAVPGALRFNRLIRTELMQNANLGTVVGAASHVLGAGAPATLFDLYVLERTQSGEGEQQIENWIQDLGPAELDAEGRGRLRDVLRRCLTVRVPTLRTQGVA